MNFQYTSRNYGMVSLKLALTLTLLLGVTALASAKPHAKNPPPSCYQTAIEHAKLAASSTTLMAIQMHLHHVLNCLEGSKGKDFDLAAGNPCNGKGALANLRKGSADWVRSIHSIALARVGVQVHDKKAAHYIAEAVLSILEEGE
jgi:hypothetical protein